MALVCPPKPTPVCTKPGERFKAATDCERCKATEIVVQGVGSDERTLKLISLSSEAVPSAHTVQVSIVEPLAVWRLFRVYGLARSGTG